MKMVRDILRVKGGDVWSIPSTATVFDALQVMSEKNIGALLVRGVAGEIAGVLSERDYARKMILVGRSSAATLVEEIMTPADRMTSVRPGETLENCLRLFIGHNLRHLPVLEGSQLLGMISSRDVIEAFIAEEQDRMESLYERLDKMH